MKNVLILSLSILCLSNFSYAESGKPILKSYLPVPKLADTLPKIKPSYSISSTFTNSYFWRGLVLNQGLMWQPKFNINYGKWELSTWNNTVIAEKRGNEIVHEIDWTLSYIYEKENWGLKPQATLFFYPSNYKDIATLEIGTEAYYDLPEIGFYINPNFNVADNAGGFYVDYGLVKSGDVNKKLSYEAMVLMGWGNKRFTNYYQDPVVIETMADPKRVKPQATKSLQIQFAGNYKVAERLGIQAQLTAFRNFKVEYASYQALYHLNAALTCAYSF